MPYIADEKRKKLDTFIGQLSDAVTKESTANDTDFAGLLNYCITRLCMQVLEKKFGKFRYWMSPLVKGIMMDIILECNRRVVDPYEDLKIAENGDVPEYQFFEKQNTKVEGK